LTESNLERVARRYELHHAVRRDDGELVLVLERLAISSPATSCSPACGAAD